MEIEYVFIFVVNVATETLSNNDLPCWEEVLIELLFQVLGQFIILGLGLADFCLNQFDCLVSHI